MSIAAALPHIDRESYLQAMLIHFPTSNTFAKTEWRGLKTKALSLPGVNAWATENIQIRVRPLTS
jgi:hypothetical protein